MRRSKKNFFLRLLYCLHFILLLIVQKSFADISDIHVKGILDFRVQNSDADESWLHQGLNKSRFDQTDNALQLGQAALELKSDITDTITAKSVLNGYTDRNNFADITEIFLQWKPLPVEGYRIKTKVGAFFPTLSLENGATGWTNPWMISSSAINTWIGEEFRTKGVEVTLTRPGILHDSAHDIEFIYSLFTANDPAGALLVWRGWSIGDRVTGLSEGVDLPQLNNIYGPTNLFNLQGNVEHAFREVDDHTGYYAGINYSYNNWISLRSLHYDNRGNPLGFHAEQWGWDTHFDHVGLRVDFSENTTLLAQKMVGETTWGYKFYGVYAHYDAWYLLLSHSFDQHRLSLRYDHFTIDDEDQMANDNNAESGHGIALAWQYKFDQHHQTGIELLKIFSNHPGRLNLYQPASYTNSLSATATENSAQIFYRYNF